MDQSMSMARDSQRSKVYAWELANIPGYQEADWRSEIVRRYRTNDGKLHVFRRWRCRIDGEMRLDECAALIKRVWTAYKPGRDLPKVTPGYMARQATGCRERINLPCWSRQPVVVLHETAHSLQPIVRWEKEPRPDGGLVPLAWHGPEFVRLYIEILVRFYRPAHGMRSKLLRSARAARIKVGSLKACPKPVRRKRSPAHQRERVEGSPCDTKPSHGSFLLMDG